MGALDSNLTKVSSVMTGSLRTSKREIDSDHVNYYRFFLPIAIVADSLSRPTARRGCGHRDGDDADSVRPLPD
jgi:hypothetical protein